MAKERIKWTYIGGLLDIGFENEMLDSYNLEAIYPLIEDMTEVQRELIIYGFKQNLSDKIAGMKDYTLREKIKVMSERADSLIKGIWKTPPKEKRSVKKEAEKLVKAGGLSEVELALLEKLGLR
jgi:predicted TIM-barrel fold metal-dependent hydrolase